MSYEQTTVNRKLFGVQIFLDGLLVSENEKHKIFDIEYIILFVVPPSLVPHINNYRSLLLNFRIAHRYPNLLVHENYKFKILLT